MRAQLKLPKQVIRINSPEGVKDEDLFILVIEKHLEEIEQMMDISKPIELVIYQGRSKTSRRIRIAEKVKKVIEYLPDQLEDPELMD